MSFREVLLESSADTRWAGAELLGEGGRTEDVVNSMNHDWERLLVCDDGAASHGTGGAHALGSGRSLVWRVSAGGGFLELNELRGMDLLADDLQGTRLDDSGAREFGSGDAIVVRFESEKIVPHCVVVVNDKAWAWLWLVLTSGEIKRIRFPRGNLNGSPGINSDEVSHQLFAHQNTVDHGSARFPELISAPPDSWRLAAWNSCKIMFSGDRAHFLVELAPFTENRSNSDPVVRCTNLFSPGLLQKLSGWLPWAASSETLDGMGEDSERSMSSGDETSGGESGGEEFADASDNHNSFSFARVLATVAIAGYASGLSENVQLFGFASSNGLFHLWDIASRACIARCRISSHQLKFATIAQFATDDGIEFVLSFTDQRDRTRDLHVLASFHFDDKERVVELHKTHRGLAPSPSVSRHYELSSSTLAQDMMWRADPSGRLFYYPRPRIDLETTTTVVASDASSLSLEVETLLTDLCGSLHRDGTQFSAHPVALSSLASSDSSINKLFLQRLLSPGGPFDARVLLRATAVEFRKGEFASLSRDQISRWVSSPMSAAVFSYFHIEEALERLLLAIVDVCVAKSASLSSKCPLPVRYLVWSELCMAIVQAWHALQVPLAIVTVENQPLVIRGGCITILRPVSCIERITIPRLLDDYFDFPTLVDCFALELQRSDSGRKLSLKQARDVAIVLDCAIRVSCTMGSVDPSAHYALECELALCDNEANDLLHATAAAFLRHSDSACGPPVAECLTEICRVLRSLSEFDLSGALAVVCDILRPNVRPHPAAPFQSHGSVGGHTSVDPVLSPTFQRLCGGVYTQSIRGRYELSRDVALLCCVLLRVRLQQPLPLWGGSSMDTLESVSAQKEMECDVLPQARDLMKNYFALAWLCGDRRWTTSLLVPVSTLDDHDILPSGIPTSTRLFPLQSVSVPTAFVSTLSVLPEVRKGFWQGVIGALTDFILASLQDIAQACEYLLSYHAFSSSLSHVQKVANAAAELTDSYARVMSKHCGGGNLLATAPLNLFRGLSSYRLAPGNDTTNLSCQKTEFLSFFSILSALDSLRVDTAQQHRLVDVLCCDICTLGLSGQESDLPVQDASPKLRYLLRLVVLFSDATRTHIRSGGLNSNSRKRVCIEFALSALHEAEGADLAEADFLRLHETLWSVIFSQSLLVGDYEMALVAVGAQPLFAPGTRRADRLSQLVNEICSSQRLELLCGGLSFATGPNSAGSVTIDEVTAVLESKALSTGAFDEPNFYEALFVLRMHLGDFQNAAAALYGQAVRLGMEDTSEEVDENFQATAVATVCRQVECVSAAISTLSMMKNESQQWIPVGMGIILSDAKTGKRDHIDIDDKTQEQSPSVASVDVVSIPDMRRYLACLLIARRLLEQSEETWTNTNVIIVNTLRSARAMSAGADAAVLLASDGKFLEAVDLLMGLSSVNTPANAPDDFTRQVAKTTAGALDSAPLIVVEALTRECANTGDPALFQLLRDYVTSYDSPFFNYRLHEVVASELLEMWSVQAADAGQMGPVQLPRWVEQGLARGNAPALARVYFEQGMVQEANRVVLAALKAGDSSQVSLNQCQQLLEAFSWLAEETQGDEREEATRCRATLATALTEYEERTR